MKKILVLVFAAALLMVACNNKPAETTEATTQDTAAIDNTAAEEIPGGGPTMYAQVIEESSLRPVTEATVMITDGKTVVQTVSTDSTGSYRTANLEAGKEYTFTVSKDGYTTKTVTVKYDGSEVSIPAFELQKGR